MKEHDEMENAFDALITGAPELRMHPMPSFDLREVKALGYLGKAVVRLDRTSSRLALVNIGLTVVIVFLTGVQIFLAVRHH